VEGEILGEESERAIVSMEGWIGGQVVGWILEGFATSEASVVADDEPVGECAEEAILLGLCVFDVRVEMASQFWQEGFTLVGGSFPTTLFVDDGFEEWRYFCLTCCFHSRIAVVGVDWCKVLANGE